MTWEPFDRKVILRRFAGWLGPDLYDEAMHEDYVAAFDAAVTASRGSCSGRVQAIREVDGMSVLWDTFTAVADGFAGRATAAHRGKPIVWAAAFPAPGRYSFPGSHRVDPGPKVSLNEASAAQLAALPGLGPATAARIVERRRTRRFTHLDELVGIKGLSKEAREQALPFLTVSTAQPPAALTHPSLAGAPLGFPEYVRAIAALGLQPPQTSTPAPSARELATAELRRMAAEASAVPRWAPQRGIDVTDLRLEAKARRAMQELWPAQPAAAAAGIALVRNGFYDDVVLRLLGAATQRAWVQMFYFTSKGGTPGDAYLDALVAARDRGVDVRLLLDSDLASDFHGASRVNRDTVRALRRAGLTYRLDLLGSTTHTKLVLVDTSWVLCGSHNWTTSSIYRYDETSVLTEDAAHAADAARRFEQQWRWLDPDPAVRTIALELLVEPLPRELRALGGLGVTESREFLSLFAQEARLHGEAQRLGLSPERLLRLRRTLALMHDFLLTEPTAHALTLTAFDTPAKVRQAPRRDVVGAVRSILPLAGRLAGYPIRLDVLEAVR